MTIDWGALGVVAVVSSLVIGRGGSGLPRVVLGATAPHTVAGTRT